MTELNHNYGTVATVLDDALEELTYLGSCPICIVPYSANNFPTTCKNRHSICIQCVKKFYNQLEDTIINRSRCQTCRAPILPPYEQGANTLSEEKLELSEKIKHLQNSLNDYKICTNIKIKNLKKQIRVNEIRKKYGVKKNTSVSVNTFLKKKTRYSLKNYKIEVPADSDPEEESIDSTLLLMPTQPIPQQRQQTDNQPSSSLFSPLSPLYVNISNPASPLASPPPPSYPILSPTGQICPFSSSPPRDLIFPDVSPPYNPLDSQYNDPNHPLNRSPDHQSPPDSPNYDPNLVVNSPTAPASPNRVQ